MLPDIPWWRDIQMHYSPDTKQHSDSARRQDVESAAFLTGRLPLHYIRAITEE